MKIMLIKSAIVVVSVSVVLWILYQLFFQYYNIGAASMAPTLIQGDAIIALKTDGDDDYQRGELILFRHTDPAEEIYVKRIIGMPGDVINFNKQNLSINGKPLTRIQQADKWSSTEIPRWLQGATYLEQNNQTQYELLIIDREVGPEGSVTVPDDHYFVMGDNRNQSRDSRFIGPVPASAIIGKPLLICWSEIELPRNVIRWDRIGRAL